MPAMPSRICGDRRRESFIEVRRRPDEKLVAVLELLSPLSKSGSGRGQYLVQRDDRLRQHVHLVEVDLLLRGARLPFEGTLPAAHYFAMVSRADRRPDCEVYGWNIQDRLPVIPIPLAAPDADVPIDLQEVFDVTFDRGPYDQLVEYGRPVGIAVDEPLARWISVRLSGRVTGA